MNETTITIELGAVELAFSRDDGGLRYLARRGGPNVLGHGPGRPSIDARIGDGPWMADRSFVRYLSHRVEQHDTHTTLEITIGIGPLILYDRFHVTGTLIARTLTARNVAEDALRLHGLRMLLPWVRIGELNSCRFDSPGASVRPRVQYDIAMQQHPDVLPRRFFAPGLRGSLAIEPAPFFSPGLMAVHNMELEENLMCWYAGSTEPAIAQLSGGSTGVTLQHEIEVSGWLASDVSHQAATQYILLMHEPWQAALAAFQRTWPLGCERHPIPAPVWLVDAAIYETHPALFGGFTGLAEALPALAGLGVNTICLLPIWPYGNGLQGLWHGNWQSEADLYAIRTLRQFDPALGPQQDLRSLVDAAHQRGMRVILDLPLLGCAPDAPLLYDQPEWCCRDLRGTFATIPNRPGIVAFDWANQRLRRTMVDLACQLVADYDLDGFRAIAPRIAPPNWSGEQRFHASEGSAGYLTLLDQLQEALAAVLPNGSLIGDLAGPIGAFSQHATIDELAHHMFVHMALNRLTPAELSDWLEDHWATLPTSGAHTSGHHPRISFTESHRTHLINPLADGLRGSRISRMVLAGLIMCGFVPSIWSGQEHDEAHMLARLINLRHQHPILRYGQARPGAIPCRAPNIFTVLRIGEHGHAIGLLNVGPHRQSITISLPVDTLALADGEYILRDLISGLPIEATKSVWSRDDLLNPTIIMEPFGTYCLVVEPAN
ncbi:MAG: alpha-amylase family glycosyl hydrolase [Roseiflexaceae bacterium]